MAVLKLRCFRDFRWIIRRGVWWPNFPPGHTCRDFFTGKIFSGIFSGYFQAGNDFGHDAYHGNLPIRYSTWVFWYQYDIDPAHEGRNQDTFITNPSPVRAPFDLVSISRDQIFPISSQVPKLLRDFYVGDLRTTYSQVQNDHQRGDRPIVFPAPFDDPGGSFRQNRD